MESLEQTSNICIGEHRHCVPLYILNYQLETTRINKSQVLESNEQSIHSTHQITDLGPRLLRIVYVEIYVNQQTFATIY